MRRLDFLAQSASVPALLVLAACGANTAPSAAVVVVPTASAAAAPSGKAGTIKFDSKTYGTPGLGGKGTQQLIAEFQAFCPPSRKPRRASGSSERPANHPLAVSRSP